MADVASNRELHPIARFVLERLESPDGRAWSLPPAGVERVERELAKHFGHEDLRFAVLSLISLAKHVEDLGERRLTDVLLSIAATACDALRSQGAAAAKLADDVGLLVTKTFAAFSAREVVRAAPKQVQGRILPSAGTIAGMAAYRPRRA
ncbi:hypothetical protein L6R52_10135 [Myxococcota bacterium]|nr:hypothetical protein [Myxococcota bacterium]